MKVREAVAQLLTLPQDDEITDEYAENMLTRFYPSTYDDENGEHSFVVFEIAEA